MRSCVPLLRRGVSVAVAASVRPLPTVARTPSLRAMSQPAAAAVAGLHSASAASAAPASTSAAAPLASSHCFSPSLPSFSSPREMLEHMLALTAKFSLVRNYVGVVTDMSEQALVVETELFPRDALEFYSKYNLLELDLEQNARDKELHARFYTPARGGGQGDYRVGIQEKLANVVSALKSFPDSKRAVLTVPYTEEGSITADHTNTDQAKCLREIHFYLDAPATAGGERTLSATGIMRAQAASIFPKNIHFIGTMMQLVAKKLGVKVGSYTHQVTTLVNER